MTGLIAALAACLAALGLAPGVEAALDRRRLRRRVMGLPAPRIGKRSTVLKAKVVTRSTAAPLLRARSGSIDAMLARMLPGGAVILAQLAGGRVSLTTLVGVAVAVALAMTVGAASLGVPAGVAILATPLVAIALLRLFARWRVRRARAAFARCFPDAIAVMIRALHAGLPITAAIAEVSRAGNNPVAIIFGAVTEAIGLGQPLETALWEAARATGLAEFDFLVVTIALQRETGGNLAETLTGLDNTLRMRRQLAMKVRAMAAEARASAIIIGSLPFVMAALLWLTSPAYLVPLFTTALGKAMLGAGLASIAIGAAIIAQLMQVKA